jgi:hypothetical protein
MVQGKSMSKRKKLPIGIQSFSKLREGGYYYVDKTAYAWQLSAQSGYFFISRPRQRQAHSFDRRGILA